MEELKNKKEQILSLVKNSFRWLLLIVCILVLIFIIEDIFDNEIQKFDNIVYSGIATLISPRMTYIMKAITSLASAGILIGICIITLIVAKNKKYGIYISLNLFVVAILNILLKNVFNRPRPEGYRLIEEIGYSFPSGHSMASMAFYGLLIYFIFKKVKNPYLKWCSCILLFLLIISIGISRIYLGVHYASDVIGGFCFSIAYLAGYTYLIREEGNI